MKELQQDYHCAIDMVIELIGGKWKVLILWNLNEGDKRFNELRRSIPDITQKMLTQQLRELEAHGLVSRTVFQEVPPEWNMLRPTSEKNFRKPFLKCADGEMTMRRRRAST